MTTNEMTPTEEKKSLSFVEQIVQKDLAEGKNEVIKAEETLNKVSTDRALEDSSLGLEVWHGEDGKIYYGKKRLAKPYSTGGVLKKGEIGLLEGSGAEAVVPLERNKYWIKAVAEDMLQSIKGGSVPLSGASNTINNSNVSNFTQNIYSPTAPSRIEIYRQTRNLLVYKMGGA